MIIDAHMHLWDRVCGQLGTQQVKPVGDGVVQIGGQKVQGMPSWFAGCRNTAEMALAAFDDAGVDGAVVTQEYLDGNQNEYLRKVKKRYPDKFFVHGLLDFRKPAGLLKEFEGVAKQGFGGIKCPAMFLPRMKRPVRLDRPELMAVWEQMQERGMILAIDLAAGDEQVEQMENVIKTFGDLKITIGHFGMVTQGNWEAQIRLARQENVYVESGGIIWLFRDDGIDFKKAQACVKQAANLVGVDKLMWGSDYPRTMVDFTYRQSVRWVIEGCEFFSDADKEAFLGGNAARVFGLKVNKNHKARRVITEP
ncbi:MAG: amidohydrolase [Sedimentisphaerales bacterium]|nr:amidohydrolase [Sedimentisphaerales bacterium]